MSRGQHRESVAGPSQRQLRVGEAGRHALAEVLAQGEVHDPVLEGHMITVPEVRMSPDLRLATIYIMPLGGRREQDVLAGLPRDKRFARRGIARRTSGRRASCAANWGAELTQNLPPRFAFASTIDSTKRNGPRSFCEHLS